jgi:hypothetical protein
MRCTGIKLIESDSAPDSENTPESRLIERHFCEAENLARIILDETPKAIEAFINRESMVEYIRQAIASGYVH